MRALVVYESMLGSTRELAEAIAVGLRSGLDVRLSRADELRFADGSRADLLVAGGPTPAQIAAESPVDAQEATWVDRLDAVPTLFAAFDTRPDLPRIPVNAASVRIGRELRRRGSTPIVPPESFLVTRHAGLKAGEAARGLDWGEQIADAALQAGSPATTGAAS